VCRRNCQHSSLDSLRALCKLPRWGGCPPFVTGQASCMERGSNAPLGRVPWNNTAALHIHINIHAGGQTSTPAGVGHVLQAGCDVEGDVCIKNGPGLNHTRLPATCVQASIPPLPPAPAGAAPYAPSTAHACCCCCCCRFHGVPDREAVSPCSLLHTPGDVSNSLSNTRVLGEVRPQNPKARALIPFRTYLCLSWALLPGSPARNH